MILVLLGTQNNSFHRLLEKIDELIEKEVINEKVLVQAGYTKYESKNMRIFDLIPQEELDRYQEQADLIITHGGVGSIISSIKKGKKVIAVPRLHEYQEHVNDHQKQIVESFDKKGYIIGIDGVEELESAIIRMQDFTPVKYEENNEKSNSKMLKIIEEFIEKIWVSRRNIGGNKHKKISSKKLFAREKRTDKTENKTRKYKIYRE